MEYAIVDIETTGGSAQYSRMTEVAVVVVGDQGQEVLRWETLLNPEQSIPERITALTGIDVAMVAQAPTFAQVADELYQLLKDRVFVAHNVTFDYSFLQAAFAREGVKWQVARLCTVRLSRKLIPGLQSYSLGRLTTSLGIPIENRHRAMGDCGATAVLFAKLLARDQNGEIARQLKRGGGQWRLPPHLPEEQVQALPASAGIYRFHGRRGELLYIGKAANLAQRVPQHFDRDSGTRPTLYEEVHRLSWVDTGNELMALVLEEEEIKQHWPPHNKASKGPLRSWGFVRYVDQRGLARLRLAQGKQAEAGRYASKAEAEEVLRQLAADHSFCLDTFHRGGRCLKGEACSHLDTSGHNDAVEAAWHRLTHPAEETVLLQGSRGEYEVLLRADGLTAYRKLGVEAGFLQEWQQLRSSRTGAIIRQHLLAEQN